MPEAVAPFAPPHPLHATECSIYGKLKKHETKKYHPKSHKHHKNKQTSKYIADHNNTNTITDRFPN